jgi:hypothetical protein
MDRRILIALRLFSAAPAVFRLSGVVVAAETQPPPPGYPPGWNVQSEHLPSVTSEFMPGLWNDTNQYWTNDAPIRSDHSRPLGDIQVIYQMKVGSDHYVEMSPPVSMPYEH